MISTQNPPSPVPTTPAPEGHRLPSEEHCGRGSIIVADYDSQKITVIPATCKSWTCPVCAPAKQRRWAARLAAGKPWLTLTLTTKFEVWKHPQREARRLKTAFKILVQKIRKTYGWFEYALVWELQKNGMPHAHILARSPYIPKPWLKAAWKKLTGAYMVDIHRVKRPDEAARHHTKSLDVSGQAPGYSPDRLASKQTTQTARALAPMRIIQLSKNYENPPGKDPQTEPQKEMLCVYSNTSASRLAWQISRSISGRVYIGAHGESYEVTTSIPTASMWNATIVIDGKPTTLTRLAAEELGPPGDKTDKAAPHRIAQANRKLWEHPELGDQW